MTSLIVVWLYWETHHGEEKVAKKERLILVFFIHSFVYTHTSSLGVSLSLSFCRSYSRAPIRFTFDMSPL